MVLNFFSVRFIVFCSYLGCFFTARDAFSTVFELHRAIKENYIEKVVTCIQNGVDVNATVQERGDAAPTSLLHCACTVGNEEILALLLENGADINVKGPDHDTPLHVAVQREDEGMVRLLLKNGADVHVRDIHGLTPLNYALSYATTDEHVVIIIRLLIEKGLTTINMQESEEDMLHAAIQIGDEGLVSFLLKRGVDVNARDVNDLTPLHWAANIGHEMIANILIENGADMNALVNEEFAPLHFAVQQKHKVIVELLLKSGADANVQGFTNDTPLHAAAYIGDEAILNLLLKSGADVHARDMKEYTPLQLAVKRGHAQVVALLIDQKADINATLTDGNTSLHIAVALGGQKGANIICILLIYNADLTIKNNLLQTPYDLAQERGDPIILELLSGKLYKIFENISSDNPNDLMFKILCQLLEREIVLGQKFMFEAFFQLKAYEPQNLEKTQKMLDNWTAIWTAVNERALHIHVKNESITKSVFKRELFGKSSKTLPLNKVIN